MVVAVLALAVLLAAVAAWVGRDDAQHGVLWAGSFDPPKGTTWQEQAGVVEASRTNATVVELGPGGREDVLRIDFRPGERWGMDYRHSLPRMGVEPREEVWFSYDVYFPDDFEFRGDGKMGGLAGTVDGLEPLEASSGGQYDERSFSVRAVWKEDRGAIMYVYAAHAAGRDIDDPANGGYGIPVRFEGPDGAQEDVLDTGRWIRVEQRVKLNTPGQDDGIYELWIDGHKGVDVTDVQYRTAAHPDLEIDQLFSSWFFGGGENEFPTRPNSAWTDEWVLSEDRLAASSRRS